MDNFNNPTPDQIVGAASLQMQIALAQEQMKDAEADYGQVADYIRERAVTRMRQEAESGRAPIRTPRDGVRAYKAALQVEAKEFRKTFRPGYQRSEYNPQIPADQEVSDYISERRVQQNKLKQAGEFIAQVGPHTNVDFLARWHASKEGR